MRETVFIPIRRNYIVILKADHASVLRPSYCPRAGRLWRPLSYLRGTTQNAIVTSRFLERKLVAYEANDDIVMLAFSEEYCCVEHGMILSIVLALGGRAT